MKTQSTFLTREGYQELEQELGHLYTVRRREVSLRLRQTRADGDVLENAGLEEALNEWSFLEGRIAALMTALGSAVIIEEGGNPRDAVGLGSHVTVIDLEGGGAPETYHVIGSIEADPINGRISNQSPVGRALIGRKVGEEAVVNAPDGKLVFKIAEVY